MGGDRVLAREIYDDPADLHARVDRRDNRSSRLNRD
jgi:hypothetical protein